jgi:hypothetical protein
MHFTLRIGQFPKSAVVGIAIKYVPSACIPSKLPEMRADKLVNSFTDFVSDSTSVA